MKTNQLKTKTPFPRIVLMAVALTLILAVSITPAVYAGEFVEGDPDATVEEGVVIEDDLFIGGETVLMAGIVEGDLFAAGREVTISGEVRGTVYATAQVVTISGTVDGNVLLGGYSLVLEDGASIGRNVYFGGFSLEAMPESAIGRSIYGGGYQLILDGSVGRDVTAGLGALQVAGPVGGDIKAEVGESTGEEAPMFNYWSPGMPSVEIIEPGYTVDESQVAGEVAVKVTPVNTDIEAPDVKVDPGFMVMQSFRRRAGEFIGLLLVGAVLLWLFRTPMMKTVDEVRQNAGKDSLWGLLVWFLYIPVLLTVFILLLMVIILVSLLTLGSLTGEMIALGFLSFGAFTTGFGLLTGWATKVVVGYLVGYWLLSKITSMEFNGFWQHFAALASGVFLYEVLRAIPILGWVVAPVVVLIGTGAIFVLIKNAVRKVQPEAVEVVSAE